jgi:hypothetical protein
LENTPPRGLAGSSSSPDAGAGEREIAIRRFYKVASNFVSRTKLVTTASTR